MMFHGPLYTWFNKRDEGMILKKLDRVLMNDSWAQAYPQSYSVFESGGISDHLRCRIHLDANITCQRKPFKFVNVVANLVDFVPTVD